MHPVMDKEAQCETYNKILLSQKEETPIHTTAQMSLENLLNEISQTQKGPEG